MDDPSSLARAIVFDISGYPLYLARLLMQIGYEPKAPDANGGLPNLYQYLVIIKEQRGYASLYTGLSYHLGAVITKRTAFNYLADTLKHKQTNPRDASELIALCLRESAMKVVSSIISYPLVSIGIGYITSTLLKPQETFEYTFENLYKGLVPKLVFEVTVVWVTIISRSVTVKYVEDELAQAIVARVPPFLVQSFIYPLNVCSTVMADNGKSGLNPQFLQWTDCFSYLRAHRQLKRGSSILFRRDEKFIADSGHPVKRYF